jgi:hypothetical protein
LLAGVGKLRNNLKSYWPAGYTILIIIIIIIIIIITQGFEFWDGAGSD